MARPGPCSLRSRRWTDNPARFAVIGVPPQQPGCVGERDKHSIDTDDSLIASTFGRHGPSRRACVRGLPVLSWSIAPNGCPPGPKIPGCGPVPYIRKRARCVRVRGDSFG